MTKKSRRSRREKIPSCFPLAALRAAPKAPRQLWPTLAQLRNALVIPPRGTQHCPYRFDVSL
ncbi:MAG: hypothetical protein ABIP46_07340 [Polaromonas sp.]